MGSGQKITEKASKLTLLFESAALNALSAIKSLMGGRVLTVLRQSQESIIPGGKRIPGKAGSELYR